MDVAAGAPGVSTPEHRANAERSTPPTSATVADPAASAPIGGDASIVVGRDAFGNVFVTGDGNTVEVKLTMVVADPRLQASAATRDNPYRGLYAFRETDSEVFFGRDDLRAR